MSAGKGYVDVSTIDPATAAVVAAAVRQTGALYLEAPVSGSKGPAEQGQLIFLTAGGCGVVVAISENDNDSRYSNSYRVFVDLRSTSAQSSFDVVIATAHCSC